MSRKEKWSSFGKNTGNAFKNFGKAVATTARVAFGEEENEIDENGKTKLRDAWTKTGKGFGNAGKSLGVAAKTTVTGDSNEAKKEEDVIDVESVEK